jgi:sodium/potassium-transporting ATPase subunit alpha
LSDNRDFPSTAAAIARQCGIITNEKTDDFTDLSLQVDVPIRIFNPEDPLRICKSIVLSGKDLNEMKDIQWNQVQRIEVLLIQLCEYEEIVFARTTPEQKLRIVKEFQKRKNVVGMTV